ncbi:MAG: hypothetical protein U0Y08_00055 [Bacteroidia bacterium]
MNKISFFYTVEDVFNTSVKALKKREYKIIEADAAGRTIKAKLKKGVLGPVVTVEMKIEKVGENQSSLQIVSQAKGGFLSSKNADTQAEQKLVNTLYRLFESF